MSVINHGGVEQIIIPFHELVLVARLPASCSDGRHLRLADDDHALQTEPRPSLRITQKLGQDKKNEHT